MPGCSCASRRWLRCSTAATISVSEPVGRQPPFPDRPDMSSPAFSTTVSPTRHRFSGPKKLAFAAVLAVFAISWIHPLWPTEQALHSTLTVVGLVALLWVDRRGGWLGDGAFIAICGFRSEERRVGKE